MDLLLAAGIILALALSFIIGMNDAGNAIATVIATRSLSPFQSILMAAIGNVIGPFLFTTAIAQTIGTGIVVPGSLTTAMIVTALITTVFLIALFTKWGFPISASHALIGSLIGTTVAGAGITAVILPQWEMVRGVLLAGFLGALMGTVYGGFLSWMLREPVRIGALAGAIGGFSLMIVALMLLDVLDVSGILAIIIFIIISPVLGFAGAFCFDIIISYIFRFTHQRTRRRIFTPLQIGAGFLQSAGHGANDGFLAVGVIGLLMYTAGEAGSFTTPLLMIAGSALAIGTGTLFGGWNVIQKMAKKITRIRPYQGFCSAIAGGTIVSLMALSGIPSSSTHIISGSIVGVGATRGKNAVDWRIVREIVSAWIWTMPISILISYLAYSFATLAVFRFIPP